MYCMNAANQKMYWGRQAPNLNTGAATPQPPLIRKFLPDPTLQKPTTKIIKHCERSSMKFDLS